MKASVFATMIFLSLNAFASDVSDFCGGYKFVNDEQLSECLDIAKNGTFQDDALKVCDESNNAPMALYCLRTIKSAMIESDAVGLCNTMFGDNYRVACLSASKNKFIRRDQLLNCVRGWRDGSESVKVSIECLKNL